MSCLVFSIPTRFSDWRKFANACGKVPLAEVPYVDRPNIQVSASESVEMPFKYVKGKDGKAIMPEVRVHQFVVSRDPNE